MPRAKQQPRLRNRYESDVQLKGTVISIVRSSFLASTKMISPFFHLGTFKFFSAALAMASREARRIASSARFDREIFSLMCFHPKLQRTVRSYRKLPMHPPVVYNTDSDFPNLYGIVF